LSELLSLFTNNLLPIFLIVAASFLFGRYTGANPRPLSQLVFHLFSPCLLFTLLTQNRLSGGEISRVMLFATSFILIIGVLTWVFGRSFRLERRMLAGVMLSTMFMNAGNFGLPVVLFAFGELALSYASLFFVTSSILAYTLGSVIASLGSVNLLHALGNLLKVPSVYALALALVFLATGWKVPVPIERTIKLLGDASIPSMLVLLGLQLQTAIWSNNALPMTLASSMRLLIGPIVAILLIPIFGLIGPARQALILEAAMPTAVLTTVLATEFNAEPTFVSAAVLITTLLTPLTITPLLAFLGA
jgi:malate permease and related proteins